MSLSAGEPQRAAKPDGWRALLAVIAIVCAGGLTASIGAPLADGASPSALILGPSVTKHTATDGSERSLEQQQAEADGFTVNVVNGTTWERMNASEFAKYQVLIIGDPQCEGEYGYAAAQADASVWQPVVMASGGNKVLIGTDPTFHNNGPTGKHRADLLEARGIAYAGALAGRTGAYVDTSCEFSASDDEGIRYPPGTSVPIMNGLSSHGPGQFTAGGAPCTGEISIVAATGPTEGLHDADLSKWECSAHSFFDHYPSDWTPLALATDSSVPKVYAAKDVETGEPVSGSPYILISGEGIRIESEITLSPATGTDTVGGEHTVTAKVLKNKSPESGKTVTFSVDSGPNVGKSGSAVTNANGEASFTYKDMGGLGTDEISAKFLNDAGAFEKATATVSWEPAPTTLATTLSGEGRTGHTLTVLEGTPVTDTATLGGSKASTAGGTVKYKVYSDSDCKTLIAEAGEVTVTDGAVPSSAAQTLAPGVYYWQATYTGDSLHQASTSACGSEVETVKATTTLTTTLSGEGKTGHTLTVLEGTPVTDTATLSGTDIATASGRIKYAVYSDSDCKTLFTEAGEVSIGNTAPTRPRTLAPSSTVPASNPETLPAGATYYWQATYTGDSLHQASTSACGTEIETVKATTTLTTTLSGEDKTGQTLEVIEGTAVKDQAILGATEASTAGGTVKYKVYSDRDCKTLIAEAGEVTVTDGAVPSSAAQTLAPGVYYWQATYTGDSLHQAATSACGKEVETVKAKTSLSTSLSGEGRTGQTLNVLEGSAVTDTATLAGGKSRGASGTVKYKVYTDAACTKLVATAGTANVTGGVVAPSEAQTLSAPGRYYWTAAYSGDAANWPSESKCGEEILSVYPRYQTSMRASVSPPSAEVGVTVTLKATLSAGIGCPGNVQFEVDSLAAGRPVALSDNAAQTTITAPTAGTHAVSAHYAGALSLFTEPDCQPSTSPPATLTTTQPAAPSMDAEGLVLARHVHACESARRFTIHLQIPSRVRLLGTSVSINGKPAAYLHGNTREYTLNLDGRPYATVRVTLAAHEQGGRTVIGERVYHTCRAHKLPSHARFKL